VSNNNVNRSHAARYVDISVYCLWLKFYYPAEFMAAVLTAEASLAKKLPANIAETRRLQVSILGPDVNVSALGFSMDIVDDKSVIRYGLLAIKGIGDGVVNEVLNKAPYSSFGDFLDRIDARVVNKTGVLALIKAGAFDSIEPNRYTLWNHYCFTIRKMLPEGTATTKKSADFAERYDEALWDKTARLAWEEESLGIFITGHPLDDMPYARWNETPNGKKGIQTSGIVRKIKRIKTKAKQEDMGFLTLETQEDRRDITLFPGPWKKCGASLKEGDVIIVTGKKDGDCILADSIQVKGHIQLAPKVAAKGKKAAVLKTAGALPDAFDNILDLDLDDPDLKGIPVPTPPESKKRPDPMASLFENQLTL
jgi:DNA polymerase-3 subunit alpha